MALSFTVKVTPKAAAYRWKMDNSGMLKCFLTSPAIEGRANNEFVKKLAKLLKIPASAIYIESGATSRLKKISITTNLTYQQFLEIIGITRDQIEQLSISS